MDQLEAQKHNPQLLGFLNMDLQVVLVRVLFQDQD